MELFIVKYHNVHPPESLADPSRVRAYI